MTKPIPLSRAVATATAALGACLLAFASPASAFTPARHDGRRKRAAEPHTPASAVALAGTGGASIVRTIVGLAIVIAVIWGLAWILAGQGAGEDPHAPSAGLASVAALTLGTGRSVHLVRAGNDYVLLGATEHGVAPIHRYTEEEAREAGLLVEEPAARTLAPGERRQPARLRHRSRRQTRRATAGARSPASPPTSTRRGPTAT